MARAPTIDLVIYKQPVNSIYKSVPVRRNKAIHTTLHCEDQFVMFGAGQALTRVRLIPFSRLASTHKNTQILQLQSFLPSTFRFVHNTTIPATMNPDISRILSFWFDRPPMEWFMPPEGFDAECTQKFGHLVHQARANKLDDWTAEPKGTLALLVLLDQFSRNVFRGTPEMYAADDKAFDIATKSIAKGFDKKVTLNQAVTFYLPLMHHESLLAQIATLAMYENFINRCPDGSSELQFHSKGIDSVRQHLDVIQRFGRFPSRNKILGRESTEEELAYLNENPDGFSRPQPEAQ